MNFLEFIRFGSNTTAFGNFANFGGYSVSCNILVVKHSEDKICSRQKLSFVMYNLRYGSHFNHKINQNIKKIKVFVRPQFDLFKLLGCLYISTFPFMLPSYFKYNANL